jgi:hypothetical protein
MDNLGYDDDKVKRDEHGDPILDEDGNEIPESSEIKIAQITFAFRN